jgi:membrane-bound lytic murein transglycosylase D
VIYKKGAYVPAAQPNLAKSNSSSKSKVYYVQPGDTLWEISKKNNLTIDELKRKNNLKGNQIKVGMKLIVS